MFRYFEIGLLLIESAMKTIDPIRAYWDSIIPIFLVTDPSRVHHLIVAWNSFDCGSNLMLYPYFHLNFVKIRRGNVDWTRYDRNRMGRIRTAIKAMMNISSIIKINVEQVRAFSLNKFIE